MARESLEQYKVLLQRSPVAMLISTGEEQKVALLNHRFTELFGYTIDDIPDVEHWWPLAYPDEAYREEVRTEWNTKAEWARRSRADIEPLEAMVTCKDGSHRHIKFHLSPIGDTASNLITFFDITERVRQHEAAQSELRAAEKALLDSEVRYRTLVDMASDGILLTAPDGRIFSANPAACRMFGCSEEEICRLGRNGLVVADEKLEKAIAARKKHGSLTAEITMKRKNGDTFPADVSSVVFKTEDGQARTSMVIRDVTEQRRAEAELRESEERYRGLFEDSKDMIIITTPDGKFLDVNDTGVKLLGYDSREEMLGLGNIADDLYHRPEDREQMLSDMRHAGFLKDYSVKYRTKTGDILNMSATLTPVTDEDGQLVAIRGILRDMTAHNRLEAQLRQSQRIESIGVLAGGVAHEFNNKLTAIQGNIDLALLVTSKDSPPYEELLLARRSCEQAADIVRQLLVFSRRETMRSKPLNLNSLLQDTVEMLGRIIGEQYELFTVLEEGIWTINADATHIEQVIMNLVINARDAMPEGGRITINTGNFSISEKQAAGRPGSRPGEFVHLSVRDTGSGIGPKQLPHIFEPFYSTKDASEGGGLGLSVVYGIIVDHNGWIEVESASGPGTTFDVYLPAIPFEKSTDEAGESTANQIHLKDKKILLVEDDKAVRTIATQLLDQCGSLVTAVDDFDAALESFAEHDGDFDLAFCDVVLPTGNGIDLVDRLLEKKPGLKVLLTTGYNDTSVFEKIRKKGYPLIQKPYSLEEIRLKFDELLREG